MAIEITNKQWTMLTFWTCQHPKIATKELVSNLVRFFNIKEADAWIIAARFKNHKHTEDTEG